MRIDLDENIPDELLVSRIVTGEKRLFEIILRRHNQRLYRIGMALLNDETEAEEAMQVAYVSAYEHLASFQGRASFATWLTRIMLNQCHAHKRRPQNVELQSDESTNSVSMNTPVSILANKELSGALETAVQDLPEKYRMVFVLREIEDLSVRQTAEALEIAEPNVKVRLNRAKAMLRASLGGFMKNSVYHFHLTKCDRMVETVMNKLSPFARPL